MTLRWASAAGLSSVVAGMEWPSVTGTPTIESSLVRSSGKAFRIGTGETKQMQHNTYSSGPGLKYYRIYFHIVTAPTNTRAFVILSNSANVKIGVRITSARVLQLFNEEDTSQIGSDSSAINTGEYYRLELEVDDTTLSATTVEAQLYAAADEATLLWNPSGTANLTAVPDRFSIRNVNDATLVYCATDFAIIEGDATAPNTWAGEGSIGPYMRPDGAGANTTWARGGADSGANWSQTEEIPPDDATTYVESNTNNQIDDYALDATPSGVASDDLINWVAPGARFAISNTTGGDPDFVLRVTAGGNTDESGNLSGTGATTYASYRTTPVCTFPLVLVDMPGGSTTPWTKSDLDSAQIGIRESATDTHFARVSAVWLMYEHKPSAGTPAEITEITTAADSPSAVATFVPAQTEALSATESPSAVATLVAAQAESLSATDLPSAVTVTPQAISESVSSTESQSVVSLTPAEQAESGSATDSPSAVATLVAAQAESLSATDSPSAILATPAEQLEAVSALDVVGVTIVTAAEILEAVTALDTSNGALAGGPEEVSESANAADSVSVTIVTAAGILETINALDLFSAVLLMDAGVLETVNALDVSSTGNAPVSGSFRNRQLQPLSDTLSPLGS